MRQDNVVFEAEADRAAEEFGFRGGCRGIVGIVEPHQLRAPRDFLRNRREVGQEGVLLAQRHVIGLAAIEDASRIIDRIAGVGDQHDIAGIDHGHGEIRDPFFRAD